MEVGEEGGFRVFYCDGEGGGERGVSSMKIGVSDDA